MVGFIRLLLSVPATEPGYRVPYSCADPEGGVGERGGWGRDLDPPLENHKRL